MQSTVYWTTFVLNKIGGNIILKYYRVQSQKVIACIVHGISTLNDLLTALGDIPKKIISHITTLNNFLAN